MKKNFISKPVLAIILIIFLPFHIARHTSTTILGKGD